MFDILNLMWIIPFCLSLGYIFSEVIGEWNRKNAEIRQVRKEPEELPEEEELDPMTLRNGYGVTRCEKPTFAEQIINIVNFSGENQKEEDYGEDEN